MAKQIINRSGCSVEELYRKYFTNIKLYFTKYTHDEMIAEDMTHDLFLKLIKQVDIIMPQTALALLLTMASRMVASDARHQAFVRRASEQFKRTTCRCYHDDSILCKEIAIIEEKAISRLSPKSMAIYKASRFEGKQADEMAIDFNIAKRTVESHLYTARCAVRNFVRQALG